MKKYLILALTLLLCIAPLMTSVSAADANAKNSTKAANTYYGSVAIDGDMDPEWLFAEEFTANDYDTRWVAKTNPNAAHVKMRTLWDEDYLYIWAEIIDPKLIKEVRSTIWQGDCLIIHVDMNHTMSNAGINEGTGWIYIDPVNGISAPSNFLKDKEILCEIADTATGFVAEVAIPVDKAPKKFAEGLQIGLEPQYNDTIVAGKDGTRAGITTWSPVGGLAYGQTNVYGTLTLKGENPEFTAAKEAPAASDAKAPVKAPATADMFTLIAAAALVSGIVVSKKRR